MLCIQGKPIGEQRPRPYILATGDCEACGRGPLHGPRMAGGSCGCSFARQGHRLCRLCACVYDVIVHGKSKIDCGLDQNIISALTEIISGLSEVFTTGIMDRLPTETINSRHA